jgi:alpha-amylase
VCSHLFYCVHSFFTPCRCATYQSSDGKWNKFGGRLAWDNTAICNNNPAWNGRGAHKTGDDYPAAPNIDHTQVRRGWGLRC